MSDDTLVRRCETPVIEDIIRRFVAVGFHHDSFFGSLTNERGEVLSTRDYDYRLMYYYNTNDWHYKSTARPHTCGNVSLSSIMALLEAFERLTAEARGEA